MQGKALKIKTKSRKGKEKEKQEKAKKNTGNTQIRSDVLSLLV